MPGSVLAFARLIRAFGRSTSANVALTFALLLVPLLLGVGIGVDYLRAYGAYSEMQTELDVALIAAIKKIDNVSSDEIETLIRDWFSAQTRLLDYSVDDIVVDTSGSTIRATATANVETTLMQLAGIDSVPIGVVSEVAGPSTSYLNVYLVLDKSASMMLASTTSGQTFLNSTLGCAFACHDGDNHTVSGVNYTTNYAYSSTKNVELRSDVLLDAVEEVLATVEDLDPTGSRIRVGLYRLAATATRTLAPTFDTDLVRTTLNNASKNLTSTSSTDGTFFNTALTALTSMVGQNGDGTSASSPLKLVMLVTDGVQSRRSWVTSSNWSGCVWNSTPTCPMSADSKKVTPLNPDWCDPIKQNGPTFATVYTTYLPVTTDWGYNGTVGATMASSVWSTTWGGTLNEDVLPTISRHDYLPIALSDCATSSDYFMEATDASEITQSLSTLFDRYLSSVRLTQ
jgi:Flp pilus assembly protein TadG